MVRQRTTFNDLDKELARLKKGAGLALRKIEKVNTAHHLLRCLDVSPSDGETAVEHAIRAVDALRDFIQGNGAFSDQEQAALVVVLNLDYDAEWYRQNLMGRRIELERKFEVGRTRCHNVEVAAHRQLIRLLLDGAASSN